jgi:Ser/Thr protein kinase RdoA (MazF antagonist)
LTSAKGHHNAAPFEGLDPSAVLDALDAVGFRGDGRVLQLNSYENRVYQVHLEDGSAVVTKFYRPARWSDAQILEEHAFALELAAGDVPVVAPLTLSLSSLTPPAGAALMGQPPTLACFRDEGEAPSASPLDRARRLVVTPRQAGRNPNLEDPGVLRWLGRYIARLHTVGSKQPFKHRRTLNPQTLGHQAKDRIAQLHSLDDEAGRDVWLLVSAQALSLVGEAFVAWENATAGSRGAPPQIRLHGDFHPGNVLWREATDDAPAGPHIVDLDDACMGPAIQDLWMLVSGDRINLRREMGIVLEGYRMFRDFDDREWSLIEPLRTLRMIHHSAWIAERWSDPAFPAAFPWFGTPGYWQQQALQLREQIELMSQHVGD